MEKGVKGWPMIRMSETKFQNIQVCQCDLDYVPFRLLFLLILYSLQFVYMLNKKPVALAVREIFTVVCILKIYVPEKGNRSLITCMSTSCCSLNEVCFWILTAAVLFFNRIF